MPVQISIKRVGGKVEFQTVSVSLSDTVFWTNEDTTEPHWPDQKFSRSQIGPAPSPNSDSWPVAVLVAPYKITYGCALHSNETGVINVYADFAPTNKTLKDATAGQAYAQQSLTVGGVGPFTWSVAPAVALGGGLIYGVPPGLVIGQAPNPNPTSVVISGTPTTAGSYQFSLQAADSLGNNFQQINYTIKVV